MIDEHVWLVSSESGGIRPQVTWVQITQPTPPSLKDLDIAPRVHKTSIIAANDRGRIDPRPCPEAATVRAVEEQNRQYRRVSSFFYPKADPQQGQDEMKQVKQPKTILVRFMQCHLWTTHLRIEDADWNAGLRL